MQLIITDARFARSRAIYLSGRRLMLVGVALSLALLIPLTALCGWLLGLGGPGRHPGWGAVLAPQGAGEDAQRERFMRENLDALARKVGQMQARLMQLEAMEERLAGLAGLPAPDRGVAPGQGGVLVPGPALTPETLQAILARMEEASTQRMDRLTVVESRLFDQRVLKSLLPTQPPVAGVALGSPFGWRIDPFTGRSALHTGLDFAADSGTPIVAAAGGVVVAQEFHPAYGLMLEIDHGNAMVSRYAHASRVFVRQGDLVKRGQKIAEVGSTGRSTGAHLHFEVLVHGVQQDPQKFLSAGQQPLSDGKQARAGRGEAVVARR